MDDTDLLMVPRTGNASLQLPCFSTGLLLEDEDLNASVAYTRDLMRLLFRSFFGCGVVCGLDVTAELVCNGSKIAIGVGRGLALDGMANPIELPAPESILYDPECKPLPAAIWIAVCFVQTSCRLRDVSCSPEDDHSSQPTRLRTGYAVKLYRSSPGCACSCKTDAAPGSASDPSGCCPESEAARAAAQAQQANPGSAPSQPQGATPPDPCPCYADHYQGVCACDCACPCVVVGKVTYHPGEGSVPARVEKDVSMVRRIRPVLNGYAQCRWPWPPPAARGAQGQAYDRPEVKAGA